MQFQALLLTVLVTLAAAAPVAEPQRGVPDGSRRLAVRDAEPQLGVSPGGDRLARAADPGKKFGGGRDLVSRDADPQRVGSGAGRGFDSRDAQPVRGSPGGRRRAAMAERAAVGFEEFEPRGVRGGRPGSNGR